MPTRTSYASDLSPEYALLGLLAQRPTHGYELHQRLVTDLGQVWHVSLSQTYNILNRLESQGFVRGTVQDQEKLPSRRIFRLTLAGRRRFDNWLYSPTPCSVRTIRVEFVTRLYFSHALNPDRIANLVEAQTEEVRARLTRLQVVLAELPPHQVFNQLGLKLRVRQLTSLLDWLAECRATLEPRRAA
jgi:DNA-binding PadR family transcriptional regulator